MLSTTRFLSLTYWEAKAEVEVKYRTRLVLKLDKLEEKMLEDLPRKYVPYVAMMDGAVEGLPCSVSMNIDNKAVFVEFKGKPRVVFNVFDMIEDAYELLREKDYIKENEGKEIP